MSNTYFVYPIANYKFGKNKPPKQAKDINLDVRLHCRTHLSRPILLLLDIMSSRFIYGCNDMDSAYLHPL